MFISHVYAKDISSYPVVRHESQTCHSFSCEESISANILNSQGFYYFKSGRYIEAANLFSKVIEIKPDFVKAYNNLGVTYMKLKQYLKAESCFRAALSIDPKYVKAVFNLSVVQMKQKKYFDAYASYNRARELDSDYVNKRFNKTKVEEAVSEIIKQEPNNRDLILALKKKYDKN